MHEDIYKENVGATLAPTNLHALANNSIFHSVICFIEVFFGKKNAVPEWHRNHYQRKNIQNF